MSHRIDEAQARRQARVIGRAMKLLGGRQTDLADAMGGKTRQGHVYQWFNGMKRVSPESAVLVERATGGKIHRSALRPDVFERPVKTRAAA